MPDRVYAATLARLPAFICFLYATGLSAQLSDWQVVGRFQFRAGESTVPYSERHVRRARFWTQGKVHPKLSVRFQYDFVDERLDDLYLSYRPTGDYELRLGQSWLPFIGDFTEAPWYLDTIDFPAGAALLPAREKGFYFTGQKGEVEYNFSVVNGNGFSPDENNHKDVYGFVTFPLGTKRIRFGAAHYEGRAGPNGALVAKRREAADFVAEAHAKLTLKGAYIHGQDGAVNADAAWARTLVHVHKRIDLVGEYDTFTQGPAQGKWFDAGVNFYLPVEYSDLKIHYRHFYRPQPSDDIKVQLQVFLNYPWRWRR